MSKNTAAPRIASADEVRVWAVEKGLAKPTRGRLSNGAVEAYNKAHKSRQYTPGVAPEPTMVVQVEAKDKNGRKRQRKVSVPLAALRTVEGVGKRGKVSQAVAREYVIGAGL